MKGGIGMQATPRIRSVSKAVEEIKMLDPNSFVTQNWLRKKMKLEEIPVIRNGSRHLVNLDVVLEYLAGCNEVYNTESRINKKLEEEQRVASEAYREEIERNKMIEMQQTLKRLR